MTKYKPSKKVLRKNLLNMQGYPFIIVALFAALIVGYQSLLSATKATHTITALSTRVNMAQNGFVKKI